jgi:hypothetical protein
MYVVILSFLYVFRPLEISRLESDHFADYSTLKVEAAAIVLFESSFLIETDKADFALCDSPVSKFITF